MIFKYSHISEETPWQDIICYFSNLENLKFHDCCTDLILKQVAKFCPSIEEIDVGFCLSDVSSEGVKYLCKNENGDALCRKLKKLCLKGTDIREDDVQYLLQNVPSLEIIDHPFLCHAMYSLHKHELPFLDNVKPYNITELDLCSDDYYPSDYADIVKVCLSVCPYLKSLICDLFENVDSNLFSKLPNLERLKIRNPSSLRSINIDTILNSLCGKLISLNVMDCIVSLSVLSENCPDIKELDMVSVKLHLDDSKPTFNSLTCLAFENCMVSENFEGMGLLMTSTEKLESLTFEEYSNLSEFPSELKTQILNCCEQNPIKAISFSIAPVETDFVKELLLKCHTLINLYAYNLSKAEYNELLDFASILPNKPKINDGSFEDDSDYSDFSDRYDDHVGYYDDEDEVPYPNLLRY